MEPKYWDLECVQCSLYIDKCNAPVVMQYLQLALQSISSIESPSPLQGLGSILLNTRKQYLTCGNIVDQTDDLSRRPYLYRISNASLKQEGK